PVLQAVHRGIVAVPVVADLGRGYGPAHGLGWPGHGVGSEVDGGRHDGQYIGARALPHPLVGSRRSVKVLVAGTGGVGGYYGARLAAAGHEVWFMARGANLAALRE